MAATTIAQNAPLKDMDEWDDFLTGRYQEGKSEEEFRQYDEKATPGVAEFYRLESSVPELRLCDGEGEGVLRPEQGR